LKSRHTTSLIFVAALLSACAQAQPVPTTAAPSPSTTEPAKIIAPVAPVSPVGTVEPGKASGWSAKPVGGFYDCELGAKLESRFKTDEAVDLVWKGKTYPMTRVSTSSGAVRMEDKASGLVWIQIPAKSMLMDSKAGRQLANECQVRK
jgi:hypothetical protein